MSGINYADTRRQSKQVFKQFGEKWKTYARHNSQLISRHTNELQNIGIGKFLLCAALGESLEDKIPFIKKYRDKIDILTCDKGFKPLLEAGIKADYVMICDCNILTKWIDGAWNETKGVKLIATPYASVDWTTKWKGPVYFYVNKDSIESERIFSPIFTEKMRIIPASTNVSNAMVTFMAGLDENTNINFSGYERFILVGYDYSWRMDGNYYAFHNPAPKRFYMHHRTMLDINNDIVFTSENLFFSARWMYDYITKLHAPVINCSGRGILEIPKMMELEDCFKKIKTDNLDKVLKNFKELKEKHKIFQKANTDFEKARGALWQ